MTRFRSVAWAILPLMTVSSAWAQSHGHGGHGRNHGGMGHKPVGSVGLPGPIVSGGGFGGYYPTIIGYNTPLFYGGSPYPFTPPLSWPGPAMPPMAMGQSALVFPQIAPGATLNRTPSFLPRPVPHDSHRSKELMTLGDRLFRAGNYVRAIERYEQAVRADPDLAEPRARLAQIALVRGKYSEAANKLREAQAAEPGWLANASDVQALYPEPADFAHHVAKLEAHLQAKPEDRDAWLVLGALWYLSGRTQKAADVFLRLSDRKEDPTLRAFLDATKAPS